MVSWVLGRDPEPTDALKRYPFDVAVCRIEPGKSLCPYHPHSAQWEFYHVMSGRGSVRDSEGRTPVESGCAFLFPPGEAHQIINDGPKIWCSISWRISDDRKSLTIPSEGNHADGSSFKQEFLFKRIAGTSGLAGTRESTKIDPDAYPGWAIEPFNDDGLTFAIAVYKEFHRVEFDGEDYPNEGPRIAPGASTSGQRVDEQTVELTDKLKDKVVDTQRLELSADGQTLTVTVTFPGIEQKEVDVYERQ